MYFLALRAFSLNIVKLLPRFVIGIMVCLGPFPNFFWINIRSGNILHDFALYIILCDVAFY